MCQPISRPLSDKPFTIATYFNPELSASAHLQGEAAQQSKKQAIPCDLKAHFLNQINFSNVICLI